MKLSPTKEIHICPIKRLCFELNEKTDDIKTIAIIISMEDISHLNFDRLNAFCKIEAFDTEIGNTPFSFNYDNGVCVKNFLETENDFERLYVCCDSGESRSTAMAAAILRCFGKSDKEIWSNPYFHPNLLVYREQIRAFGIKVSSLKLKYLKYINNRALKMAIHKY